jgi:hypothetical protein
MVKLFGWMMLKQLLELNQPDEMNQDNTLKAASLQQDRPMARRLCRLFGMAPQKKQLAVAVAAGWARPTSTPRPLRRGFVWAKD